MLIVIPLALFTSSILLVISSFARDQKEAQTYILPFFGSDSFRCAVDCARSRIPYPHRIRPDIEPIAHHEADFWGPIRPSLLRHLTGNFVSLRVPRHEARRILFSARANPFQSLTVHNKTSSPNPPSFNPSATAHKPSKPKS